MADKPNTQYKPIVKANQTATIQNGIKALQVLLKPQSPASGPPLPASMNVFWPGYFSRGIDRLQTEGVKGPYKTIQDKGLMAEIKREIQVVTGVKL